MNAIFSLLVVLFALCAASQYREIVDGFSTSDWSFRQSMAFDIVKDMTVEYGLTFDSLVKLGVHAESAEYEGALDKLMSLFCDKELPFDGWTLERTGRDPLTMNNFTAIREYYRILTTKTLTKFSSHIISSSAVVGHDNPAALRDIRFHGPMQYTSISTSYDPNGITPTIGTAVGEYDITYFVEVMHTCIKRFKTSIGFIQIYPGAQILYPKSDIIVA